MLNRLAVIGAGAVSAAMVAAAPGMASAHGPESGGHGPHGIVRTDLASDQPDVGKIHDDKLKNSWGIALGPTTPVWVANAGSGFATLFSGATSHKGVSEQSPIKIPAADPAMTGQPTGQVFNTTKGFVIPHTGKPAAFIIAGRDGTINAFNGGTSAVQVKKVTGAVFTGIGLIPTRHGTVLAAADARNDRIDFFNSNFQQISLHGAFEDHRLPADASVFNIQEVGGRTVVTYEVGSAYADPTSDKIQGFVDEFSNDGRLQHRLVNPGVLQEPWGLTIAPRGFEYPGDLLVGNFRDGKINVFDPRNGHFIATLRDDKGHPIVIDGLWGLVPGNGVAGDKDDVLYAAGPNHQANGLYGILSAK
ncbi:TIGR03118 family protein [Actinoplanes sp. TBRC 11911]|uniref:TIGR03118 family protein n=1 Tax=Actinoplanes sp. TBRC 11911 TaxID=2729386 RepID=UPI00145D4604|nr:TIGR03118 family protein [Actinoplanes sp. TBRC 11911]NMO54551.1 TIGR03118 family protein [Actinoplanes sp. TBRC 11911]